MTLEDVRLLFGLAATVVGGLWAVFVYYDKKRQEGSDEPPPWGEDAANRGIPVGALGATLVLLAGMVLVGWSMFLGADRSSQTTAVTSECGAAAGGDITGSTFDIDC